MRKALLATAMTCTFAFAGAAWAQTPTGSPNAPSVDKPAAAAADTPPAPPAPAAAETTPPAAAAPTPATPPEATAPAPKPAMAMKMKKPATGASASTGSTGHEAMSASASHISSGDTGGDIAPKLPAPKLGPDAGPDDYLTAAKQAIKAHRTGEAQESLEMAETRLLDRSTEVDKAGMPDGGPKVTAVHDALAALAKKDYSSADSAIDAAMSGQKGTMPSQHQHKMWKKKPMKPAAPPATP